MPGCVPRLETGLGCRVIFGARMHAKVGYREIPSNLTDRGGTMHAANRWWVFPG